MSAVERGIVLDAETAELVPDGARCADVGANATWWHDIGDARALPGYILTHIGGRPVAELVAEADQAKADARWVWERANEALSQRLMATADALDALAWRIDGRADLLIDARLVAAWHAQWADTEEVERG